MLRALNPTTLYLVRHGAVISVSGKAYIGQIEAPLSEEGVEQAWALRKWLEPVHFTAAFSSDLSRAQRTCRIVTGKRSILHDTLPSLREISLGEWEGISFREIEQRFPEAYASRGRDIENWRPPAGESFADCRVRILRTLNDILAQHSGNVLVVGHGGVNRLILCEVLGIPVKNLHSLGQDYGCVNIIDFSAKRTRVQLLNYTPLLTRPVEQISPVQALQAVKEAGR
jgi:probable phosphoglycerate mutase